MVARHVDLQEDARIHSVLVRDPMQIFGERERIDAVKQLKKRKRMADLVLLEVSDEMPAQARRQEGNFGARLLHPAFAEEHLAGCGCGLHFLGRVGFRDRDQFDVVR